MNRVTLVGHVGRKPELSFTANGTAMLKFSLATSQKLKNGTQKTEWHNVVAWQRTAEDLARVVDRGTKLFIDGRIETQTYEKDGQKRYFTNVVANWIEVCQKAPEGQRQQAPASEPLADDVPF